MSTSNPVLAQSYTWGSFIGWSAWDEMERHLKSKGVCAGVGGARGSGKSWLLRHAVDVADKQGVGVYFPSPSAYDSSAFLAGLCLALATKAETKLRPERYVTTALLELVNKRSVQFGSVAVAVTLTVVRLREAPLSSQIPYSVLAAIMVYMYIASLARWREQRLKRNPMWRLYLKSLAVQRWVQFSSATTTNSEIGIEFGKGLIARGTLSEELALSERPVTELALVTEFRSLAEDLARQGIPVVIAIDELDKIGAVDDVRKLLRSIKGVLDPAGVVLLVSVSDEAVTHLGLSGLRGRDEISSSFNSMIQVPPLARGELRSLLVKLLGMRKDQVADAVWVLTAGNQRESVRLLDDCLSRVAPGDITAELCVEVASEVEARELLNALVVDPTIGEEQKTEVYQIVRRWRTDRPVRLQDILKYWEPHWSSEDGWPRDVAEEWRRFLVRHALRFETSRSVEGRVDADLGNLSHAFLLSQHSASVARHLLEEQNRETTAAASPMNVRRRRSLSVSRSRPRTRNGRHQPRWLRRPSSLLDSPPSRPVSP